MGGAGYLLMNGALLLLAVIVVLRAALISVGLSERLNATRDS
jgi:hypothetical protein